MSPAASKPEEQIPSLDELVTAFKRRGHFDSLRKSTLASFQTSSDGEKLVSSLSEIVHAEVERDSNLLYREKSKSSILIGGAVDRAGILDNVTGERDAIFEQQKVHDNVKAIVSALLTEMNQNVNGVTEDKKE